MGTTFYAYSVLTRQTTWQSTFRYIIIMAGAVVIVAYLIYFLRHKHTNKYRDLLILVALIELLTIGIQIRDLQASRTATADSQAVATLLRSVRPATDRGGIRHLVGVRVHRRRPVV